MGTSRAAAVLLTLAACLTCRLAALPQGHKVIRDEEYGYSRQYMYGRRDHGAMQMHHTDKQGQTPWRATGVKRGMYGMYDHYMIGRVQPLKKSDGVQGPPRAAEVKRFPVGAASHGSPSPTNHRPEILLLTLPLLAMV